MSRTLSAPTAVVRPGAVRTRTTRLLLAAGIAAGPLFLLSGLAQAVTREGFDLTRHALSQLSLGEAGWIQSVTFLLTGVLAVAGAVGLRRVHPSPWAPRLIAVFGAAFVLNVFFEADPGAGFPIGTPDTAPAVLSTEGTLHMATATLGFLALCAAFLVLGRHFAARGMRGRALVSRLAPVAVLGGSAAAAVTVLAFTAGAAFGLLWLSAIFTRILVTADTDH